MAAVPKHCSCLPASHSRPANNQSALARTWLQVIDSNYTAHTREIGPGDVVVAPLGAGLEHTSLILVPSCMYALPLGAAAAAFGQEQ